MPKIKDPPDPVPDLDYPLTSQATTFLRPNGIHSPVDISDIEMIALHSLTYTSIKDLLPIPSPLLGMTPSPTHNSSWDEIPIKNPLVKHAAWAYLQPMSTPPVDSGGNFFVKLKDKCCYECGLGCFAYFGDVVLRKIQRVVYGVCRERRENDDDDDEDDDDEDEVA